MNAPLHDTRILETERLCLRPLRKSDAGLISLYSSDLRVARMTTSIPHPNPPGAVELFIERVQQRDSDETTWAIDATKGFGCEVVGVMSLRDSGELGYWIAPFFWGLGIATEAGCAVVEYGFRHGHSRIHATHFLDNPASGRVMQKLGMIRSPQTPASSFSVARGETVERVLYERSKSDG